jgi:sodium transport system permease protein
MNWKHVHLIFLREMNDQLRDRRTLFTITILPMLLYPLLGMLMMQIAQFNREHTVRIRIVGAENWPSESPLLDDSQQLLPQPGLEKLSKLVEIESVPWPADDGEGAREKLVSSSRAAIMADVVDAVLIVEPEFEKLLQQRLADNNGQPPQAANPAMTEKPAEVPTEEPSHTPIEGTAATPSHPIPSASQDGLQLIANLARDNSKIAQNRLEAVLDQWRSNWVATQLAAFGMNPRLVDPIYLTETDTSESSVRRAMLWSKVLPFVMLVWALTGAFYPAIDLCAGEKERGTLETLLSSPARRREIVWGKLLTISVFSVGSALLNLLSMHLTASIIVKQLASQGSAQIAEALGPMPIHAFGWLVLLLLPMAAFFSALALAVAALARSTKEGQYYLMPLLLVTLPLVALPMIPSLELNLGTSLVPVSGAVFLVRSLIEGRYTEAIIHLPVVMLVTACCCSLAIRWAIRQFESEAVMFREADRWSVKLWLHQVWRDRGETASPTEAILCGMIILIGMFFAQFVAGSSVSDWSSIVTSTVVVQIGLILTPCLLMAIFLTRSLRNALRIHRTQPAHVAAAVLIGIAMHPSYLALGKGISQVYKIGDETAAVLQYFQGLILAQPLWSLLLLMALLPAVCEELAFRGFIFGGLLRQGGALRAIVVSALFFGFTHPVLQQSMAAALMGLLLGLIAWRTGGVLCTVIVHAINNTLSLTLAWCAANQITLPVALQWAISNEGDEWGYQPEWIAMSVFLSLALLVVLFRRNAETRQTVQAEMA